MMSWNCKRLSKSTNYLMPKQNADKEIDFYDFQHCYVTRLFRTGPRWEIYTVSTPVLLYRVAADAMRVLSRLPFSSFYNNPPL